MLVFPLLCNCPVGRVDRSLVGKAVEDAKGKGGVPEYLREIVVSIAFLTRRVRDLLQRALERAGLQTAAVREDKTTAHGLEEKAYVDPGCGRHCWD